MKIFATGDTHGNFERFRPEYFPERQELTKEDVVLQLGDFGGVWFGDERDDEALDWLEGLPFTVAFVSGNHENYDALTRYPVKLWQVGRVQPVRPHVLHLMRGQVYTHCAPTSIALQFSRHNVADHLTDFLQEVKGRAQYHYWLFGHYHDNKVIDAKHILLWEQIVQIL